VLPHAIFHVVLFGVLLITRICGVGVTEPLNVTLQTLVERSALELDFSMAVIVQVPLIALLFVTVIVAAVVSPLSEPVDVVTTQPATWL